MKIDPEYQDSDELRERIRTRTCEADKAIKDSERLVTALIDLGELTATQILEITETQIAVNEDFSQLCTKQMDTLCQLSDSSEKLKRQRELLETVRERVDVHAEALYRLWSRGHKRLAEIFQRIDAEEEEAFESGQEQTPTRTQDA